MIFVHSISTCKGASFSYTDLLISFAFIHLTNVTPTPKNTHRWSLNLQSYFRWTLIICGEFTLLLRLQIPSPPMEFYCLYSPMGKLLFCLLNLIEKLLNKTKSFTQISNLWICIIVEKTKLPTICVHLYGCFCVLSSTLLMINDVEKYKSSCVLPIFPNEFQVM